MTDQHPVWIQRLIRQVIERDRSMCINCDAPAVDVHHIIPRSRGKRWSPCIWHEANMCCVCRRCHKHTRAMRERLLGRIWALYRYDMAWAKEFGFAVDEAA
jgi:5-methylcytosine-specific restriction endonuclease McrA